MCPLLEKVLPIASHLRWIHIFNSCLQCQIFTNTKIEWHFKTFSQINSFHSAVFSRCFGMFLIRDENGLKMTKKKLVVKCEIYVEIPSDSCILAGIYSNGWFAMGWHFNDLAFKHHFREYMTRRSQITSVDAWHMNVKVYGLSHLLTRKGDKLDRTQTHCVYSRELKCEHIFYISKYYQ